MPRIVSVVVQLPEVLDELHGTLTRGLPSRLGKHRHRRSSRCRPRWRRRSRCRGGRPTRRLGRKRHRRGIGAATPGQQHDRNRHGERATEPGAPRHGRHCREPGHASRNHRLRHLWTNVRLCPAPLHPGGGPLELTVTARWRGGAGGNPDLSGSRLRTVATGTSQAAAICSHEQTSVKDRISTVICGSLRPSSARHTRQADDDGLHARAVTRRGVIQWTSLVATRACPAQKRPLIMHRTAPRRNGGCGGHAGARHSGPATQRPSA